MSTEYRRGIPSTAHVEAATRLGLLWRGSDEWLHRFRNQNGRIEVCYFQDPNATPYWEVPDFGIEDLDFRPIRPDGTPVDWEMLDQEVARVGQPQTMACNLTASAQAHGFRADLWQRIRAHLANGSGCGLPDVSSLDSMGFRVQSPFFDAEVFWPQGTNPADILTCWTVYQELKPLYDLVDGAQGEAAMPGDVVTEWARQARGGENIRPDWELVRTPEGLLGRTTDRQGGIVSWSDSENWLGQPLRNFAAVLDAVAERRVAERMREQTPANPDAVLTVTSAQPEPRRFADVRPDRHGWRWWRIFGSPDARSEVRVATSEFRWGALDYWLDRTVIPTDEQGNPVSWEVVGFAAEAVRGALSLFALGKPARQPRRFAQSQLHRASRSPLLRRVGPLSKS